MTELDDLIGITGPGAIPCGVPLSSQPATMVAADGVAAGGVGEKAEHGQVVDRACRERAEGVRSTSGTANPGQDEALVGRPSLTHLPGGARVGTRAHLPGRAWAPARPLTFRSYRRPAE